MSVAQPEPSATERRAVSSPPLARELGIAALQLCSVPETCALLRVSRWQVYQLINKRQLGSIKIGRRRLVPLDEIEAYLRRRRRESAQLGVSA